MCAWTNDWTNNPDAGDLRLHDAHYSVPSMEETPTIYVYYFWTLPCYTRVFQYILVSSCTILQWNASFLFLNIWWYGYKEVIFKQNENVVDSPLPIYWLSDSISILWLYYWQEADVRTWWLIICRFRWHDITAGDVTAATAYLINEYSVIANWLHNLPIWAYFYQQKLA